MFVNDRPDLITLYFDEPDKTGHYDGPNSDKVSMVINSRGGVMGRGSGEANAPPPKGFKDEGKNEEIFSCNKVIKISVFVIFPKNTCSAMPLYDYSSTKKRQLHPPRDSTPWTPEVALPLLTIYSAGAIPD